MLSALKALSYAEIDVTKTYKVGRVVDNLQQPLLKLAFNMLDHIIERDGYPIPVRMFLPDEQTSDGILLFFHGGGWVTGNIDTYIRPCAQLANLTGHKVASVDYRLAPEHPFPCGLEDCYFVAKEIMENAGILGADARDIVLVGDSAGGNIAAAVSLMARDRGEFRVHRQVLIYPATYNDHGESSPFPSAIENACDYLLTSKKVDDYISLYIQNPEDMRNPYFAPLLADDLSNQPKTLVLTAEFDPLRDEGEAYGEKLRAFGADVAIRRVADGLHGIFMLPSRFPVVREVYRHIQNFLKEEFD